jgi:D-alanyl-lipoteichoic acid acyltransferase DltB (MBOAT superfamily)
MNSFLSIFLESFSLGSDTMLMLLPWIVLFYYIISLWHGKKVFLLLISIAFFWFISQLSFASLSFILVLSGINFLLTRLQQKSKNKILFVGAILFNLVVLILFKYIPSSKEMIYGITNIMQIVGLSFYIFHLISLFADIRTEKIESPIQFLDFMNFLLYFPKIITGPLTRYNDFLTEINKNSMNEMFIMEGIGLIIIGLLKKGLADYIGQYPTNIYANPEGYSGFEHLFAMYGYAIYIFLDFSAYTDLARGISRLFGIELPVNFNSPYRSLSMTEFWRRWHISLSLWIRDYLYIPLGGSKKGSFRSYINIMIAFTFSGIWHGVGWNYMVWGVMHGLGVVANKFFSTNGNMYSFFSWFLTFHWVALGWIVFANPLDKAWISLNQIATSFEPEKILSVLVNNSMWYGVLLIAFIYSLWDDKVVKAVSELFVKIPYIGKLIIFIVALYLVIVSRDQVVHTFIYQNF